MTTTQTVCFAAPLMPGTTDADREAMRSCAAGGLRAAHEESRRRLGIRREGVWIQETPAGDVAVVLIEADDLGAALAGIAGSHEPFDAWFRDHVRTVHGLDLSAGMAPPEQVLDFRA